MSSPRLFALLALAAISACHGGARTAVSPASGSEQTTEQLSRRVNTESTVLLPGEITTRNYDNAYTAIAQLHPNWLRPRGTESRWSKPKVGVFEAGRQIDLGLDYLRQLGPDAFSRIVYVNSVDSSMQFGMDYSYGAIVIYPR